MAKKKKGKKKLKKLQHAPISNDFPTEKIKVLGEHLSNLSSYADVNTAFLALDELKKEVEPLLAAKGFSTVNKNTFNVFGIQDAFGYAPQGSNLVKIFPNPFGIFAYLADNYAPVRMCRNIYKKEISSDGFYLTGNESNFKSTMERFKEIGMKQLRIRLADYLSIFGNFWLDKETNLLGGIKEFKLLRPQDLWPIMNPAKTKIIGWQYREGINYKYYKKEDLLHGIFDPSMANPDLGSPKLGSLLVDMEADIQASMYNNTVFQKGGLIGLAVLMETQKGTTIPGQKIPDLATITEAKLRANNSGARSGYETIVFEGVSKVEKLHDLASMDGAFHKTNDRVKKDVSIVLGVPYSRVGVVANPNAIYSAASLEDGASLEFDKSVFEIMEIVDDFINDNLLPLMGIFDVKIKAHKRYNSLTRIATQSLLDIAQCDGVMSKDEGRMQILKLPPLGGKEGKQPLRKIPQTSISVPLTSIPSVPNVPIPAEEQIQND